jgi:serine/threonine-protein kinase HipA
MTVAASYQPTDEMSLWWLGQPDAPERIGRLEFISTLRGVGLRYDTNWLRHGFALSEDLPLRDHQFLPTAKDSAVGAVDDARPDRWGERMIRTFDRPVRLSLMEYLYFAGDDRFGALGVSLSLQAYQPHVTGPLPQLPDLGSIEDSITEIFSGAPVNDQWMRLVKPGASMGGARPKALIELAGAEWVLKFREEGESTDTPLIEHATMTLAHRCGISVAQTKALPLRKGHAIAVRRFDRRAGKRIHSLSAAVVLRACAEDLSYPALALWLRRKGSVQSGQAAQDMRELFRRMVFNILIDNNDDHEKNHVVQMDDTGRYALSPAFDLLPTGQALGFQQMRVGTQGTESTLENAISEHSLFGLRYDEAVAEIARVARCVEGWAAHFKAAGVSTSDLTQLAAQIDRPFLREQRLTWSIG